MKQIFYLMVTLLLSVSNIWAQGMKESRIPLIGETAPSFSAESTDGTIYFPRDYGKKWKILFSHPLDFTPVCSSEILELAYMQNDFDKMDCKLVVVSTDNLESHKNWKASLESLSYKNRTGVKINFPLVDDHSRIIAGEYGMIHPLVNGTAAVRGVFIIDPDNKIRAIYFNPLEVGRNLDELKRTVLALQTVKNNTVFTPANWQPGGDVLVPYVRPADYNDPKVVSKDDPKLNPVSWYMVFKKMN